MAVLLGLSAYVMYADYQLRQETRLVMRRRPSPVPGSRPDGRGGDRGRYGYYARGLDAVMTRGLMSPLLLSAFIPHSRQTPALSLLACSPAGPAVHRESAAAAGSRCCLRMTALTGERESGTLKLVLSGAVSRAALWVGNCFGGFAVIAVPFSAALGVVAYAVLLTRCEIIFTGNDLIRLLLMAERHWSTSHCLSRLGCWFPRWRPIRQTRW